VTVDVVRVSSSWLELREPADAAARASDLIDVLRRHLPKGGRTVIHDLGCGTGSMGRWLAPRLSGPQHWILYDRDPDLLARAATDLPRVASRGAVTVATRQRDITRLDPSDLSGASLITASALLDMLTTDELERFVAACIHANCPTLVSLSVIGHVEFTPADPLDADIEDAFNAHQRRITAGRWLLGPDAVGAAAGAFRRYGADVLVRPSPWRLGADRGDLAAAWFAGWVDAAREQRPELTAATGSYVRRRAADLAAGRLGVTVHHHDLLALPGLGRVGHTG
jgi:SAM-dependent methyltransferase